MAVAVVIAHWATFVRSRAPQLATEAGPHTDTALELENPTQKRASVRRDGNPIRIHIAFPGQTENPHTGYVLDRSLGGLGMTVERSFEPGEILAVRPAAAPEMTPWYDVEVLRCQNSGEGWNLSCRFVKTPPYSILLLFG